MFFTRTFSGGVHPPGHKEETSGRAIQRSPLPVKVVLPLSQHTGIPASPVVKAGDRVKAGDLIAKAAGYISSPVHASLSGKVTRIAPMPHPVIGRAPAIVIETDDSVSQELAFPARSAGEVASLSREALLEVIRDAGIVGLGGAAFPTHVKLAPPKEKPVDTFILNGAECEPYLTCDEQLMRERPDDILKGLAVMAGILGVRDVFVAIEKNKPAAIAAMKMALRETTDDRRPTKIVVLPTKYPQGAEKQLIKSVLGRTVPSGGLPMDVGCVVNNAGTALAVYEAVYLGKPLIERCVTVAGDCFREPVNLLVRNGTLVSDIVTGFGTFLKTPSKVVFGGPMMGIAQYAIDVPVIKGTSGILFLSGALSATDKEGVCIRCAKCIEACPMLLEPTTLTSLVKRMRYDEAAALDVKDCIECGACAYDCPARIPLVQYMKLGKAKVPVPG